MVTRDNVIKILALFEEAWPHSFPKPGSDDEMKRKMLLKIQVWHELLADVPAQAVIAAAKSMASGGREFMPTPGQLRQAAFDLLEGPGTVPSAQEAWGEVQENFTRPRSWINWSHQYVEKAVKAMGGFHRMGQEPVAMVASARARFIQTYEIIAKRERQQVRMLPEVREAVKALAAKYSVGLLKEGGE